MRHGNLFFPAASTLVLFLLASCSSAPPAGPAAKPAGQGGLTETQFIGYKCETAVKWLEPFQREYFTTDLTSVTDYQTVPQIGNLFRDSAFVPVFGLSYTPENAKKLAALHSDLIERCIAGEKEIAPYATNVLHSYRSLFAQSFARFDLTIARFARESGRHEQWLQNALVDLASLPNNRTGMERLEGEIATPARTIVADLWPYEQEGFAKALTAKRQEIAAAIDTAGGTPSPSPPGAYTPEQAAPVQSLQERLANSLRDLEAIPLTVAGRQQSLDWITSFERDFSAYNGNDQVIKSRWAWLLNREKIFKATKDDFLARLAKLPTGLGAETAHVQLLTETFPLRTDQNMAVYQEYRAAMLARQKPFFRRTFEMGLDKLLSVREWLSDAARKAVHGSGGKESR